MYAVSILFSSMPSGGSTWVVHSKWAGPEVPGTRPLLLRYSGHFIPRFLSQLPYRLLPNFMLLQLFFQQVM